MSIYLYTSLTNHTVKWGWWLWGLCLSAEWHSMLESRQSGNTKEFYTAGQPVNSQCILQPPVAHKHQGIEVSTVNILKHCESFCDSERWPKGLWLSVVLSMWHRKYSIPIWCTEKAQDHIWQYWWNQVCSSQSWWYKSCFQTFEKGLFYSDAKYDIILINTVDGIKNKYTIKEYSDTCKAQSIQDIIGWHSTKDFIRHVEGNVLPISQSTRQAFCTQKES